MKKAVIGMQNTLMSEAVVQALQSTGAFRAERVMPDEPDETLPLCKAMGADLLILEVAGHGCFTLEKRLAQISALDAWAPGCKSVLICDETTNPFLAEKVKIARQNKLIDAFFFTSVTASYLTAALDAL